MFLEEHSQLCVSVAPPRKVAVSLPTNQMPKTQRTGQ